MRLGITGHQRLKDASGWDWVRQQMNELVEPLPRPLAGVTSLAVGADQLFAEIVMQHSGSIEVIVPFDGYEESFTDGPDRSLYQRLLQTASRVEVLRKESSDEEAYMAAGRRVVDLCELLVAVWDGEPAAGLGGTADVVSYGFPRDLKAGARTLISLPEANQFLYQR